MLKKNQRSLILFLQSALSDEFLFKSEPIFRFEDDTQEIVVPFFEGDIGNITYCNKEDIASVVESHKSTIDQTYFIKSFMVETPTKTIKSNVWLTLPKSNAGYKNQLSKIIPVKSVDVAVLDAVSKSLNLNLEKAIIRNSGNLIFDTSDAMSYVKTAAFRWLSTVVEGMVDGDVREVPLPLGILNKFNPGYEVSVTLRRLCSDGYTLKVISGSEINETRAQSLPLCAGTIASLFEWYDLNDSPIIQDTKISNEELSENLDQIITEDRIGTAVSAMESIESQISSPTPNLDEVYKLVSVLQSEVLGFKSRLNRLAELSDTEVDAINSSLEILRASVRPISINIR